MTPFDKDKFDYIQNRQIAVREFKKLPFVAIQGLLQILTASGDRSEFFKTCITCEHWEHKQELCKKFNARPPAKIIADGCKEYECSLDDVPF